MNVHSVYINDSKNTYQYNRSEQYWRDIDQWARQNCASYVGYMYKMSATSVLQWDEIGEYRFFDGKDAVFFELKWNKG
jgi:hypothetical protein